MSYDQLIQNYVNAYNCPQTSSCQCSSICLPVHSCRTQCFPCEETLRIEVCNPCQKQKCCTKKKCKKVKRVKSCCDSCNQININTCYTSCNSCQKSCNC